MWGSPLSSVARAFLIHSCCCAEHGLIHKLSSCSSSWPQGLVWGLQPHGTTLDTRDSQPLPSQLPHPSNELLVRMIRLILELSLGLQKPLEMKGDSEIHLTFIN